MIRVCAGVLLRSGMVLLARRGPGQDQAGKWEFPGGRIEAGESPAQALARELQEELGIEAEVSEEAARSRHRSPSGEIELIGLFVKKFTGEIRLKVHDKILWVQGRRLLEHDLAPADIPIAEVVAAHRRRDRYKGTHPKSFSQKYKELTGDAEAVAKAKARGSTPAGSHIPVMAEEVLAALDLGPGERALDCTLGAGGHARLMAQRVSPGGRVVGLDRDSFELERTRARLAGLPVEARHARFSEARAVLDSLGIDGVDAVLADLGVSSMQLDRPERGLSFKADGPLDMRMDSKSGATAAQWLGRASEAEIVSALERYGDEPDARAVARELCRLRDAGAPPKTTAQLAAAVGRAKGLGEGRFRKKSASSFHPATRTFQALRIVVNDERGELEALLAALPGLLNRGGRAVLLSFHSGEEALVSGLWSAQARSGLWAAAPVGPVKPSAEECRNNPRARSARLWRVIKA